MKEDKFRYKIFIAIEYLQSVGIPPTITQVRKYFAENNFKRSYEDYSISKKYFNKLVKEGLLEQNEQNNYITFGLSTLSMEALETFSHTNETTISTQNQTCENCNKPISIKERYCVKCLETFKDVKNVKDLKYYLNKVFALNKNYRVILFFSFFSILFSLFIAEILEYSGVINFYKSSIEIIVVLAIFYSILMINNRVSYYRNKRDMILGKKKYRILHFCLKYNKYFIKAQDSFEFKKSNREFKEFNAKISNTLKKIKRFRRNRKIMGIICSIMAVI